MARQDLLHVELKKKRKGTGWTLGKERRESLWLREYKPLKGART